METEKQSLFGKFWYKAVEEAEIHAVFGQYMAKMFGDSIRFQPETIWTAEEVVQMKDQKQAYEEFFTIRFVIYHEEEFVGWMTGREENYETFYMENSGVLPKWRGKGVYSAMMKEMMKLAKEKGYQIIKSRHNATNNAILVPKLRAGFLITGFELSDRYGTMIHLSYFLNPKRREVMDMRSGFRYPGQEILEALDFTRQQNFE
ncbi:MAG: GNAT family N-acetyltransferase [Bacteroidota bacterium]